MDCGEKGERERQSETESAKKLKSKKQGTAYLGIPTHLVAVYLRLLVFG